MSCWLKVICAVTSLGSSVITGTATVQDGDTIYVNQHNQSTAIRLWGVDAEELSEPNGPGAKLALEAIIGSASVSCTPAGARSYSRTVARCYIGGVELNQSIVASGWALDCRRYSGGVYRKDEAPGARQRLKQKGYC